MSASNYPEHSFSLHLVCFIVALFFVTVPIAAKDGVLPQDGVSSCAGAGCVPGSIIIVVKAGDSDSVQRAIEQEHFVFRKMAIDDGSQCAFGYDRRRDGPAIEFVATVPGFKEAAWLSTFRAVSGVITACREQYESSPTPNFVDFKQDRLPPAMLNADGVESVIKAYFEELFKIGIKAQKVELNVIQHPQFIFQVELFGPSRYLLMRDPAHWEKHRINIAIGRPFDDEKSVRLTLQITSGQWALWPENDRPGQTRFQDINDYNLVVRQTDMIANLAKKYRGTVFRQD
jgi:hypothetical protein